MANKKEIILKDLEIQWNDHFHMRDQTWKTLQYSILFFLGVIGLELKDIEKNFLIMAYLAVIFIGFSGLFVAIHHRRRQKEKFKIIKIYEEQLGLLKLIQPVLDEAHKGSLGKINTTTFVISAQIGFIIVSIFLIFRFL